MMTTAASLRSSVTICLVPEAKAGPFVFHGDLRASCQAASELGYHAVEIFAPGPDAIAKPELQSLLRDLNLGLAAVGTGAGWVCHRLTLADGNPQGRQRAIDFVKSMIDFGATFGAPAIIGSMQGRSGAEVDRASARGYLAEALEILGAHASSAGVGLIYEPLNRYETDQVNTLRDGVKLLESLSATSVRLLGDLFHMGIEESDIADAIRQAGSHLGHVHFVDSNRRPVGLGHSDLRPVIAALREIGYDGHLSAEAFPYPDSRSAAAQTILAFRYWTGSRSW